MTEIPREEVEAALSQEDMVLLKWLGEEDYCQYGECHGSHLDRLVNNGLAKIHEGRDHQTGFIAKGDGPMYQAVSLTEAGRLIRRANGYLQTNAAESGADALIQELMNALLAAARVRSKPSGDHPEAALAYALWDSENTTRMDPNCIQEHIERAQSVMHWLGVHGCEVVSRVRSQGGRMSEGPWDHDELRKLDHYIFPGWPDAATPSNQDGRGLREALEKIAQGAENPCAYCFDAAQIARAALAGTTTQDTGEK